MDVTSSSTIVGYSQLHQTRFDVFLSFRGEDTRHSFTAHLYEALLRMGINTFRDDDDIPRGEDLKPEIESAILKSKASIVVLSENYAKSRWCLDELLLILARRRNFNHFVLPVFYHVNPSDVRNQRQSFAIEANRSSNWTRFNVNRWKAALHEVANLTGMVLSGSEPDFISKIVDTVYRKLDLKHLNTPPHLTGIDARAESINSWLREEQSSAEVLAICGMGGSGKTTLAQHIYNSNKKKFESCSFLEDIGKHFEQPDGLLGLQKQLLRDILGGKNEAVFTTSECTFKIEEALQMKRVLIVLDDIDDQDELGALLGTNKFHTKSKIIITTRLLNIHAWFETISRRCWVHELNLLNENESLELLSFHAFGSKIPMEGFMDLAVQLARYCAGNPLALKVLGSSLYVSAGNPRGRSTSIQSWRSTLNSLNSLKGDLDQKIQGILRRSYDSLPCHSHRELFLHIAVFFVGEYEDYVVKIMEQDWHAKSGIVTLINRCLLTVSPSNKLMMHQLLQEMGRKIVREESKDPAKRSRVWQDDESYHVLGKASGSETIEGLALDMRKVNQGKGSEVSALRTGLLAKMDKLKLLKLKYAELTGSHKKLPELTWLCLHGYCLKTVHSGLLMSSLVALDMSCGKLKEFDPPVVLNLLKILKFKGCNKLVSIHNLARLPNLETLILWDCICLSYISESIGGLRSLALLDLTGCKNLWKVSRSTTCLNPLCVDEGATRQMLSSLPHSLEFLFLNDCDIQDNGDVPVPFGGQSRLYINLGNSLFESLPDNIDLKTLRVLDLTSCPNLKSLINLPSTLEELYTYSCTELEKITFQSARFTLLEFGYVGCINLSEIQGLFKLVPIEKLDEADLGHMKWIKAYQYYKVDLVGDEITKGRIWNIQMLYEYGIRSTYLPFTKDQHMTSQYMSVSPTLSFRVPFSCKKGMIKGLNVTLLYRSSGEDEDMLVLFAKISNRTKGLTWIYNPVVFGKPKVGKDVVWVSYWPIGNILDAGDEIKVSIMVGKGLMVSGCGATLVDGQLGKENCENYTEEEEVIGGDLSKFELTTGGYYLCRRDMFTSSTPDWLKMLISDTVHYTVLQGWIQSRQSQKDQFFTELKTFRGIRHGVASIVRLDQCTSTKY